MLAVKYFEVYISASLCSVILWNKSRNEKQESEIVQEINCLDEYNPDTCIRLIKGRDNVIADVLSTI